MADRARLEEARFRSNGLFASSNTVDEALPRLAALCSSADVQDKLAGVNGIEELVRSGLEDPSRIVRLAANVSRALPAADYVVVTQAAKVFAKLAALGGLLMITPVDNQLKATIEWLQGERVEMRRFTAVTLLRELAKTVPTLMYEHIPSLLDNLWTALRDPKLNIRETAATAMAGCLNIAYQRDGQLRQDWYSMVFEQAQRGFKMNTSDSIHGSLLAYKELFLNAGMFMQARYVEVCDQVLSYRDHRENQVRRAVIELIPTLASYNHMEFVAGYLHKCMVFLLGQLKKDRDRAVSFHAVGHVAVAVGSSMAPYLDAVLNSVKEGLQARGRKNAPPEASIFLCIQMLAKSVGQVLTKHMHELLDLMFGFGLSTALCLALHDLASHIPPLLSTIQDRLLETISQILGGQSFKHPGAPLAQKSTSSLAMRDLHMSQSMDLKEPMQVKLALDTLGTFDFSGHILSDFVRNCVVAYLEDDSPEIRMAAAQTCCRVFARDTVVHQTSQHAIKLVGEVLEKLLTVAIADPDPTIRVETFYALDLKFDRHLAQAENVRSVFLALNDEVYEVREIAIKVIGRLASHNPAYVMPPLRRTLIQLLTELEYSTQTQNRRDSAALLGLLVASSLRLTKPYVIPILKVLLPKARDKDPTVAASIMTALGELARVGGEDVLPRLSEYMSLIMESLGDQASPFKREAALKALGQLASHTGYVIEPYIDHPALLTDLIGILQTDAAQPTRREAIKVMGILGALDPYRHTAAERAANDARLELVVVGEQTQVEVLSSVDDSYYPSVAFKALLSILNDKSLVNHHTAVVEAIMYIFRSLRLKCVVFLPMVMPSYIAAMRSGGPQLVDYYLQNLGQLIAMIKQHARAYLPSILAVIHDYWGSAYDKGHQLQTVIVELIESLAVALEGEFKIYLPTLLPPLLAVFDDPEPTRISTQLRVLRAFTIFGLNLEEYLHLVVPVIVRAFERPNAPLTVRKAAMSTLASLCRKINFSDHASRVIHPLTRSLLPPSPVELRAPAMEALCALLTQIGSEFAIFVPTLNKVLMRQRIQHAQYDLLVSKLLKGEPLPLDAIDPAPFVDTEEPAADAGVNKLPVNQQNLKVAWEINDRPKAEDWREWIKRLSVQLLKSSPSHSLRACASLAEVYQPLARELFNAAFVSVWSELYDAYQEELVRSVEAALSSPTTPTETIQMLLNLAEFMEHDDKILPIPMRILGTYAMRCSAFAKALHYKELEALSDLQPEILESLVSINQQLQQHDTAEGILTYAQKYLNMEFHEEWYEKLEKWDEALDAYSRRYDEDPNNTEVMFGKMTCLHALGEWEDLSQLAEEHWPHANLEMRRRIAPLAAAAFWGLAKWEQMDDYISVLRHDSAERAWYRAILNIHRGQFPKALSHIVKARDAIDNDLTTLAGESYNRAYSLVVRVQMLAELEEIIQYKESLKAGSDSHERRVVIQKTWMSRLRGCERDVEVWQRILKVRALVMTPRENMEMWIKFANLCRKSGRLGLAEKTINSLLGEDQAEGEAADVSMTGPPHVIYAQLKLKWATGLKGDSLMYLSEFAQRLAMDLGVDGNAQLHLPPGTELELADRVPEFTRLLARCYYKLGEWQRALQESWGENTAASVLQHYQLATKLDSSWHKAWHAWALANSEVIEHFCKVQQQTADEDAPLPSNIVSDHLVPAITSFFRSIALSPNNALQDTLRLLTLWFKHGEREEVSVAMQTGFSDVSVDTWLQVIPQVIARIYARGEHGYVRRLVQQLLTDIGRVHPQALVYPLTVASKYDNIPRQQAALAIISKMRDHSPKLIEQALLVSGELVRVCNLWHEQWHEGLEEASRLFFAEKNVQAMLAKLEPLHEMADRGPETLKEMSFIQTYGRDLQDARDSCRRFKLDGDQNDMHQAWDLYHHVFRKMGKTISSVTFIELQYTSPKLLAANDLELAIPGTYQSGKPIVRISKFAPQFDVLPSKQHPRKMKITGSDGRDYPFLLKGHEDLRQDERVMQLFGLVNTLLSRDPETFKRHLTIQKYPVIPLATSSGLLGWLPATDTLHVLIKGYRDSRKILLNIEHRLMLQMAPDYDNMCLMQKIEVFEYALDNTTGQDLYRILWLKSKNSEAWLERRTNYTRSLAVMSMVGHVLGLGDRHPSNLLLDRHSGMVIHVDFGDTFEVAQMREKYPEQVPFRLTRMLVRAMEISGIEGTFRITCEGTMRVLRENQESIIAVLEAFVHDPLINWRLVAARHVTLNAQDRDGARNNPYARRPKADETNMEDAANREEVNDKALQVIERVNQKLTGRDFKPDVELSVSEQVEKLIQQAQSIEAFCQSFVGCVCGDSTLEADTDNESSAGVLSGDHRTDRKLIWLPARRATPPSELCMAAPAPPPPPSLTLPPGWSRYTTPDGKTYFANAETKQSSWVHPAIGGAPAPLPPGFSNALVAPAQAQLATPAQATELKRTARARYRDEVEGTPWLRIRTADGTIFFYNAETKSSSWVAPADIQDLLSALDARMLAEKKKLLEEEFAKARAEAKANKPAAEEVEADEGDDEPEEEMTTEQLAELAELRAEMDLQRGAVKKRPIEDDKAGNKKKKAKVVHSLEEVEDEEWQREIAAEMAAEAEAEAGEADEMQAVASTEEKPVANGNELTTDEQRALFKGMLAELDINPMRPWEMELPKFVNDPRYTAVKKQGERRDLFEEYCHDKAREKRAQKTGVKQDPAQAFRNLLVAEVTSTRAHWDDFRRAHKKDSRFRDFGRDDREREQAFKKWLRDLGEIKRADAQRHEELFFELLAMQRDITPDSKWSDVKRGISHDPRYEAVGSSSLREAIFNRHLARLVRKRAEPDSEVKRAQEKQERQAASLREREEKVKRDRLAVERAAGRSRAEAGREEGERELRSLLIDSVRDHETKWEDVLPRLQRDSRFTLGNLAPHEQRTLFDQHIEDLRTKRVDALEHLFEQRARALNTPFADVYPHIVSDAAISRLQISPEQVERMFESWQRKQRIIARNEFDALLGESAFVNFFGRLRKEAHDKEADDSTRKALAGDDEEEAAGDTFDLRAMAASVNLKEIEAVLRHDSRYRAFDFLADERAEWIRAHLDSLAATAMSIHSK